MTVAASESQAGWEMANVETASKPGLGGHGEDDRKRVGEEEADSDDEKPLAARKAAVVSRKAAEQDGKSGAKKVRVVKKVESGAGSKRPLEQRASSCASVKKLKASQAAKVKEDVSSDEDDHDDVPLAQRKAAKKVVRPGDGVKSESVSSGVKRALEAKAGTSQAAPKKKVKPSVSPKVKDVPSDVKDEPDPDSDNDDDDDIPLSQRSVAAASFKKVAAVKKSAKATRKVLEAKKAKTRQKGGVDKKAPGSGGGQKWTTLEHSGVIFPPPYQPHGVKMLYDGKPVDLTEKQEEVATMFAMMKDTEYATKERFISNFWSDWKALLGANHVVKKFELCDFTSIYDWYQQEKEKKKQMSSEEKKKIKEEKLKMEEKYMWALVDGVKEKVGNFRVEPPGLFRGRGDHPKMGKLKKRILPKDIVINISKGAPIPECPIPNSKWKEVRHDNTVTWLAYWNDPINPKEFKYVFLAASSNLKGQSDKEKYEKSRTLKDYIEDIRKTYTKDFGSTDMTKRQIAVATYLIDRLALRAGNEKDDDEADTVGCCSLKVEHVTLVPPKSLEFDFLGKDSIRYNNTVEVEEKVYKAIGDFKKGKKEGQDLFDKLDTNKLNAHLKEIMPNLTAKVFRTYNASITLDNLLFEEESTGTNVAEKIADYQRANKEVAILCNHQRTVSKTHGAQMERLQGKMADLEAAVEELVTDLEKVRKGKPLGKDKEGKPKRNVAPEALEKRIVQHKNKIEKMKLDMSIKDDLKTVALGTSKINYMDPRITVAWCKRHEVPIEKIFNKSLLAKFAWAMDVEPDFRF